MPSRSDGWKAVLQAADPRPEYVPRVIMTDRLPSYGGVKREAPPDIEHRQSRWLNNRAENSHRSARRRERQMQHFGLYGWIGKIPK